MEEGDTVGERFLLERLVGQGGVARVFLASDRLVGNKVALKVFPALNLDARLRFEREAELLAGLDHPGIVSYVAHGAPPDGTLYLAMEYLRGEDLADRLYRSSLGVRDALKVCRQVAAALAVAHKRGVVHRDIKPSNLFLVDGSVDKVKVLDFGIARIEATSTLTSVGYTLGTPAYMAPEQARGDSTLTPAVDVFALGCVLFECLTGRPPFEAQHALGVLTRILLEDVPKVSEIRADVPESVDDLIAILLMKESAARPADASVVLGLIDGLVEELIEASTPVDDTSPSLTGREQQLLSILFVGPDVPGAISSADPDVVSIARSYGARTERLVDGTILVLMPGRCAAAVQAERAARCALAIGERVPSRDLALVTGRADLSASLPVGDVIDRGAELLLRLRIEGVGSSDAGYAPPGVVLDPVSADLIGSRFHLERSPLGWQLRGQRVTADPRLLLGRQQVCFGREAEIARLVGIFDLALQRKKPGGALIVGEAGIGKSLLRTELSRALASHGQTAFFIGGRGESDRPFGVIAPALRAAFGIREDEPLAIRQDKIRRHVSAALGSHEAGSVAELLGELCEAPFPDEESPLLRAARADAIRMGDHMWRAWHAFIEGVSRTRAVVFIVDDLHAADKPSLGYIDAELRNLSDRPIVAFAFARPEVATLFPELWLERGLDQIELGPLSDAAGRAMVRAALRDRATPTIESRIVERAGGNPLFIEEMVRGVASGRTDDLPANVLSLVEARLEELDPHVRRVLRAASVFGRSCFRGALEVLCGRSGRDLDDALDHLVTREFLVRRAQGSLEGETEYVFRHALVESAAYATLTAEDRVLGHELAGRWLAEYRPSDVFKVGEHLEKGNRPQAAAAWFERAAELAFEGNDFASALGRAERSIACGAEGATLGKLKLLMSECRRHRADNAEMVDAAEEAREIVVAGTTAWFSAVANVVLGSIRLGDRSRLEGCMAELSHELSKERVTPLPASAARIAHYLHFSGHHDFATRLLSAAWSESDGSFVGEGRAAWFHRACATRALVSGDVGSYLEHLERAVASFVRAGDVREPASESVNVGFAQMELGLYDDAERTLRGALAETDSLGLAHAAATARENLGAVLMRKGRLDEARAMLESAIASFERQKNRRMEGNARVYLGELFVRTGEAARAESELRASTELLSSVKPLLPFALAVLARLYLTQGNIEAARAAAETALSVMEEFNHPDEGEALVRLANAEVLHARKKTEPAKEAAKRARDRVLERAARIRDPRWRESFLAVDENAATLEFAELLSRA